MTKEVIVEVCFDAAASEAAIQKWQTNRGYTLSRVITDAEYYTVFERTGGDNDPPATFEGPVGGGNSNILIFHNG